MLTQLSLNWDLINLIESLKTWLDQLDFTELIFFFVQLIIQYQDPDIISTHQKQDYILKLCFILLHNAH